MNNRRMQFYARFGQHTSAVGSEILNSQFSILNCEAAAACDAFEASFGQQDSAVGSRIAKNAEFNDKMDQMIATKATITHMVPNFCTGNPGAIAAWNSAAHVESPPKKPKPPTPPTP